MATTCRWIWGWRVTSANQNLPFDRSGDRNAVLRLGTYTAQQFAEEVKRAMNSADSDTASPYLCEFSFSTRQFTLRTQSGAVSFSLEFSRSSTDCATLLGFGGDSAGATSHVGDAVGQGASSTFTWVPADPVSSTTPVSADQDGNAGKLLQRRMRIAQHETDGGLRETVLFSTDKLIRLQFKWLGSNGSPSEQTRMESLLDWLVTGAPVNFQPDSAEEKALRLVLANTTEIQTTYSWLARPEIDYPELTFIEQLSRT